jgi:molecular chaperone HscB
MPVAQADSLFSLLGLEPCFDLDMERLEAGYFQKQRLFHPDRFIGRPPVERQAALQRSVDINEAYRMIKNPLTRAQCLLAQHGIRVGTDHDNVPPDRRLLMDIMEWREAIDEAEDPQRQKTLREGLEAEYLHCLSSLSSLYGERDWAAMAQAALRLGYVETSIAALDRKKKMHNQTVS